MFGTATMLDDGRVLITGGATDAGLDTALDSVDIFDPATGTTVAGPPLAMPQYLSTAVKLPDCCVSLPLAGAVSPRCQCASLGGPGTERPPQFRRAAARRVLEKGIASSSISRRGWVPSWNRDTERATGTTNRDKERETQQRKPRTGDVKPDAPLTPARVAA